MTTVYTSPPDPYGKNTCDIPFHFSVIDGVRTTNVMCLKGEGKRLPQGSLYSNGAEVLDYQGESMGLLYYAVCKTCQDAFSLLYDPESGLLHHIYRR